MHRERATSRVTSVAYVQSPAPAYFATWALYLRDGAEAVDVHGRWAWESVTTMRNSEGRSVQTFCCTGPAAPYPLGGHRQWVDEGLLAYTYHIEWREGDVIRTFRVNLLPEYVSLIGEQLAWREVHRRLAAHIDER